MMKNYRERPVRDRLGPSIREDTLNWTREGRDRWQNQRMRFEQRPPSRGSGGAAKQKIWLLPNHPTSGWSEGLKDLPADPIPQPRPKADRPPTLPAGQAQRCFKEKHLRVKPTSTMRERARRRQQERKPEILAIL